jgi:hypothetical protein
MVLAGTTEEASALVPVDGTCAAGRVALRDAAHAKAGPPTTGSVEMQVERGVAVRRHAVVDNGSESRPATPAGHDRALA